MTVKAGLLSFLWPAKNEVFNCFWNSNLFMHLPLEIVLSNPIAAQIFSKSPKALSRFSFE